MDELAHFCAADSPRGKDTFPEGSRRARRGHAIRVRYSSCHGRIHITKSWNPAPVEAPGPNWITGRDCSTPNLEFSSQFSKLETPMAEDVRLESGRLVLRALVPEDATDTYAG